MRADVRGVASALAFGAAAASVAYTAFALTRLGAFERRRRERAPARRRPHVTVLKPLHGEEPQLEGNLRSFCTQDYPAFDVVLAVRDELDAALPVARRVAAAFPARVRIVAGGAPADEPRFANPKIANLRGALGEARGEILAIADSDMRVAADWLDAVAAAFDDPDVGAATCIYAGEPATRSVVDALGAMWITEQFAPSVLAATALEPLRYCFGATMAVRRDVFAAIGGARALASHVADDHVLGRLVTERGMRVALVPFVVTNVVHERGIAALFRHELRWARTIRTVRPASYPGIALTYPLPLAALAWLLARDRRAARILLRVALVARVALQRRAHGVLGRRRIPPGGAQPAPLPWLLRETLVPLRDALGFAVWIAGFGGGAVRWRGARLRLDPDGTLREVTRRSDR